MFRSILICATVMLAPPVLSQVTADSKGEFEVLQHISRSEYASARKYAEAELKRTDGESIWANYALGVVHSEGEGNLARGLFLIRKAKDMLYARYSRSPVDAWARTWGRRLLMEEFGVLGLLDQREGDSSPSSMNIALNIKQTATSFAYGHCSSWAVSKKPGRSQSVISQTKRPISESARSMV